MMTTPICDFVRKYAESGEARFHMPGHKGASLLGFEPFDITEINGADSLYEANGIIAESESNASALFGANTFYSAEGSSLCIRAMMYLLKLWNGNTRIIAARNSHKAFISAAALLDIDVEWIYNKNASYLSADIDLYELEKLISDSDGRKTAVYITSPDYLGNVADIKTISEICKKYGALLCVDNAHGAYLRFLPSSLHPIDFGADICCDSAHKTLPVITGGAYLHISKDAPEAFARHAKEALSLFGSTSPSYLILQSLDNANRYLSDVYRERLADFITKAEEIKASLSEHGYTLVGNEPLKIVIDAKKYGYFGAEMAEILRQKGIICEFADRDFTVLMLTPENSISELEKVVTSLISIKKRAEITENSPMIRPIEKALSIRDALFCEREMIDISDCVGRIFAEANIACPPAVPLIIAGERIDRATVDLFEYYGIEKINVTKQI